MSDVRSLLRSELAARKGSSQSARTPPNRVTKKRKVDNGDDLTRKKMRHAVAAADQQLSGSPAVQPPSAQLLEEAGDQELEEVEPTAQEFPSKFVHQPEAVVTGVEPSGPQEPPRNESTENVQTIDEDEWAAFERDVVAPTRVPQAPAAVAAAATISAAPMTAEEIAAQQQRDNHSMVRAREAEAEGEREDAARFLEEEFDEMEQLEERVRRLKQKREELRAKRAQEAADAEAMDQSTEQNDTAKDNEDEEDDDDEDDDDWDNWRFR